jgi:hypothetical protein
MTINAIHDPSMKLRRAKPRRGSTAAEASLNRLTHLDRVSGERIRRYEHEHPGDLLHVDVKKLGKVPDGGGWRYVGRPEGMKHRAATAARPGEPKSKYLSR